VLIIAPGDLHQQIVDEAWEHFGIAIFPLDSQATFGRLSRNLHSAQSNLNEQGRPIVAPDFYITSYTQLTTNGVERLPDPLDWPDPTSLRQWLCLKDGEHVGTDDVAEFALKEGHRHLTWDLRPDFQTTCHFFAWRGVKWASHYAKFMLDEKNAIAGTLRAAYERELEALDSWRDPSAAEKERAMLIAAFEILKHLVTHEPDPEFATLTDEQQAFVVRHFCAERLGKYAGNEGVIQTYEKLADGTWRKSPEANAVASQHSASNSEPPAAVATWEIKCVYSPSLSDLCYNAFRGIAIDEGVKLKGADTYVGTGVRQMAPEYRLVLTATPIKNRVPDLFWLAHWATGGKDQAHARFPYKNQVGEQTKFAETFMVCEQNLTRQAADAAKGGRVSSARYKKVTAEVCNIHRLWKLLGPVVLRRRKDDCGEDIVPKVRKVIRCKMGTLQADVYKYHLDCIYVDKNGDEAIGARLQALRMAAADPSSLHLKDQPGHCVKPCRCTLKTVPPEQQLQRLEQQRKDLVETFGVGDPEEINEHQRQLTAIEAEIKTPVQRYDTIPAKSNCPRCQGRGTLPLPARSGQAFIPKHASVLNLVQEILARGEQVVIGSAFNDPLDHLSRWLDEAGVRHLKLDGRTSPKQRGQLAATFKRGRYRPAAGDGAASCPVLLAGVECMAEGHSFHLANNVILLAYSWAYDKFIQFINRVHRLTSPFPVNVYVVICDGTIDRKLESLCQEKGDSSELVLDGRLIGERSEEVNLAELLKVAQREFNAESDTLDEALVHAQWPALREQLRTAMAGWDQRANFIDAQVSLEPTRRLPRIRQPPVAPAVTVLNWRAALRPKPDRSLVRGQTLSLRPAADSTARGLFT
jgi:hypothetical protein